MPATDQMIGIFKRSYLTISGGASTACIPWLLPNRPMVFPSGLARL